MSEMKHPDGDLNNVDDAESLDKINDAIDFAYKLNPWRDGSAREPLIPWRRQNNLRAAAPDQLKRCYMLFKQGYNSTPIEVIMTAPGAEAQWALLSNWYNLNRIDRPTVKPKRHLSKEDLIKIRKLRRIHFTLKEISIITGKPKTSIGRACKDILIGTFNKKRNIVAMKVFGYYFCQLGKAKQEKVIKLIMDPC
jgi:hypothetical protein